MPASVDVLALRHPGRQWATISSVVVCKRHLVGASELNEDQAYMHTLRFLLERLSWFARDSSAIMTYTLAHIVRMELAKLREYEANLRGGYDCRVHWPALDPKGGRIDQPKRIEMLQAADLAAPATYAAFNRTSSGTWRPATFTSSDRDSTGEASRRWPRTD